jgi:uncharacterized membrane protein YhiD involved in acid resistance
MNFLTSLSSGRALTIEEIILNIVTACIMSMLVVGVYRVTNRSKALNKSLVLTMVILSMVVCLVMMVIGNSIARAFSLVGALSIIRFRTVVKDNRDIAYIFFALAAGMSAGVGAYTLSLFGVGTILGLLLMLDFIKFGAAPKGLYLLRFQYLTSDTDEETFRPVFDEFLATDRRVSVKTVRMGQFIEHTYMVRVKKDVIEQKFVAVLSAVEGMDRVSLVADDNESEQ